MKIIIKKPKDIEILRTAGSRLAAVLDELEKHALPGVTTKELDELAEQLIRQSGDTPAFLGYHPPFADRAFPASLCVSVNDEVVHGIPSKERSLREGDIVGLDLGLTHNGLIVDSARTVAVGRIADKERKMMDVCRGALDAGIRAARGGAQVGDISNAIGSFVQEHGSYGIPRELGGHGVGYRVHEEPDIPNFGKAGRGPVLVPGMVVALEPMINLGTGSVTTDDDGYTIRTRDGEKSVHFEHTIAITDADAEILTAK